MWPCLQDCYIIYIHVPSLFCRIIDEFPTCVWAAACYICLLEYKTDCLLMNYVGLGDNFNSSKHFNTLYWFSSHTSVWSITPEVVIDFCAIYNIFLFAFGSDMTNGCWVLASNLKCMKQKSSLWSESFIQSMYWITLYESVTFTM